MTDVLSVAASAPAKSTNGPTIYTALREPVTLPSEVTVGAPLPEMIGQLVARKPDATPFVVVCERAALGEYTTPLAVLNARNIARHAITAALTADDKLAADDAKRLSAERREQLNAERKAESKRCTEYRADVTARVLMAYTAADDSAA